MQHKLSARQRLLMSRLVTLGDWANSNELPVRPVEIRGFGSFFRGKPNPHDVDLLIKADTRIHLPEFDSFIKFLEAIRYDDNLDPQFATPHDAIAELVSNGDPRTKIIEGCDIERLKRWVAPYSWNMLRPQTMAAESAFDSPRGYTKRLIKSALPNINVLEFMMPDEGDKLLGLRCGFTVSVWSTERPDTAANLKELMTDESMRKNAFLERAYFVNQIPHIAASVNLHEAEITLLKKIPTQQLGSKDRWIWFDAFSKDHPDLNEASAQLEKTRTASKEVVDGDIQDDGTPLREMATEVDQLRKELKYLYARNDQMETLRNLMLYYRAGQEPSSLDIDEFAIVEMLNRGSKAAKVKCREFLKSMNYPVDRILQRLES